jgi:hypothetical protein
MESYFFNISTPVRLLLFRRIANAIDDTEIMAAVSKIRLYESGDGNEAEMLSFSDSTNTWFACIYNLPSSSG